MRRLTRFERMTDNSLNLINGIAQEYYDSRPNKEVAHKKLAVFFIASPGSGKTSLRLRIVEELQATYICNDEVRALLTERNLPAELLRPVVKAVWERLSLEAPNKFIVFDSNVSASFAQPNSYINLTKAKSYELFIVRFDIKPETLIERIGLRDGEQGSYLVEDMPNQTARQNIAKEALRADFILGENDSYDEVVELISARLAGDPIV